MNAREIRALKTKAEEVVHADDVTQSKNNTMIFRKGFFYKMGGDAEKWKNAVSKRLSNAGIAHVVMEYDEVYKDFIGGASIKRQSHWYVTIKLIGLENENEYGG